MTATAKAARPATRTSASPVHHGLYHFSKKVVANRTHEQVSPIVDFREAMVELHAIWYDVESHWHEFLETVRKNRDGQHSQAGLIADRLMNVAVSLFTAAVRCSQRPGSQQMAINEQGLAALIAYGNCPSCEAQGDIESVIPGLQGARWKLRCPSCHTTWFAEPDDNVR